MSGLGPPIIGGTDNIPARLLQGGLAGLTNRCVVATCMLLMWLIAHLYHQLLNAYEQSGMLPDVEYSWFFRLLLNLAGYATIMLPGFVLYTYLKRSKYFDKISSTNCMSRSLYACFGDPLERLPESIKPRKEGESEPTTGEGAELAFCFTGLMGAYLVWGLLQEKIMTQSYAMPDGSLVRFNDSQFLVFINRFAALAIALARLACTGAPLVTAPLYKYSYCALTNVISAWCQYEALKYVSFPTQVLSKSCKVIPVMLMGKLVSRNKYEVYEYVTAVLISVGMVMFMFGSHDEYSGIALILTLWSQCHIHPVFAADCLVLSASSAIGQLLIYRTISRFGAVVFTIIMTLRQAVSILLSCLVYRHRISIGGAAGVVLVFLAIFLRVYCKQRLRRRNKQTIINTR
ncbi:hypothetical protein K1T71_012395 [Dendrolimus kikuchii]|uniref:Uncharacterized protein n=1 Tax=Dendrolimus kikuchii TaxID=765133 RepID=A0ACC1CLR8_9NEOP|nr:hypothetical protein K1T71_012395 [Dendrolimus kikuchii]